MNIPYTVATVLIALLLAQDGYAQQSLAGSYVLEGQQGGRQVRVDLTIQPEPNGRLRVVRTTRLVSRPHLAAVWTSHPARPIGRRLYVTFTPPASAGAVGALTGAASTTNRLFATYRRDPGTGLLRETVLNLSRRAPEDWWRVARTVERPASAPTVAVGSAGVTRGPGYLILQEREIGAHVTFDPFRIRFLDGVGGDIGGQERHRGRDEDERPLAFESDRWHGPTRVVGHRQVAPNRWELDLDTSDGTRRMVLALTLENAHRLRVDATLSDTRGVKRFAEALSSQPGESLYGGGERFNRVEMGGETIKLWTQHQHDVGNLGHVAAQIRGQADNCPMPLVVSTRGYAVSFDTTARGALRYAKRNRQHRSTLVVEDDHLSYYVVAAPDPLELVGRAAGCYGRARVPPKWFFAPHKWRDDLTRVPGARGDSLLLEDARKMRRHRIPLGAVWLDNPWDTGFGDFRFRADHFPDPDRVIRDLRAEGANLMIWVSPYLAKGTRALAEARTRGYLIRNRDRGTRAMVDLTNPAAVTWWKDRIRPVLRRGVMGIKADRGEEEIMGDRAIYHDGRPDRINHNRYPLLYAKAVSEVVREVHGNQGVSIGRCGGAGAWRHWTALWTADNISWARDPKGMKADIRAHISASLSGYPFVGGDAGGYIGLRRLGPFHAAMPGPATLTRWVQFAAFTPLMQVGGQGAHEVWDMEHSRPGITAIYRRYATHHMELFPYLYELAQHAHVTGQPLIRAMWLVDPYDPELRRVEDQYMLGDALLVAPVTTIRRHGTVDREVRLPRGTWVDLWTGRRHGGGREVVRRCDLATMPVYLQAGAILPLNFRDGDLLGLGRNDLDHPDRLGLCFARAAGSSERTLHDGARVRLTGERLELRANTPRRLGLKVYGREPLGVTVDGNLLPHRQVRDLATQAGWAHVSVPGGPGYTLVRAHVPATSVVAIRR